MREHTVVRWLWDGDAAPSPGSARAAAAVWVASLVVFVVLVPATRTGELWRFFTVPFGSIVAFGVWWYLEYRRGVAARWLAAGSALAVIVLLAVARTNPQAALVAIPIGVVAVLRWSRWIERTTKSAWSVIVALLVAGVACVALKAFAGWNGLGLIGVAMLYLSAGAAVTRLRLRPGRPWWHGVALLAASVAVLAAGGALLWRGAPLWGWMLLVLGVVIGLVALNLVSEHALVSRGAPSHRMVGAVAARPYDEVAQRTGWFIGGGALLVVAFAVVLLMVDAPWTVALVLVLVLLLAAWALVVDNEADVVMVLVVVGVFWSITPAGPALDERHRPAPGQRTLIAFGDSYMSGEGAQVFFAGTDDDGVNECRRSPTAYAAMSVGPDTRHRHLAFLPCSGARAAQIYRDTQYPGEPPVDVRRDGSEEPLHQIGHLRSLRRPAEPSDLVVVSIGGNDAGFSAIGLTCLAPGDCSEIAHYWTDNLDHVRTEVAAAYQQIRAEVGPDVPVLVVPYPNPVHPDGCDATWLSENEHAFVNDFVQQLNRALRAETRSAGFWFLDEMEASLSDRNLRLCDTDETGEQPQGAGINFIGLRSVNGTIEQRLDPSNWAHNSLHPNELGHGAMHEVLERWLVEHQPLTVAPDSAAARPDPRAVAEAEADRAEPPCGLTDASAEGCRAQARDWAQQQLIRALWPGGLVPLAGFAGAWLLWIGVVARFRARWSADDRPEAAAAGASSGARGTTRGSVEAS